MKEFSPHFIHAILLKSYESLNNLNQIQVRIVAKFLFEYTFLDKQPVYKELALGRQIAKQLSVVNSLSLSNNENYRLRKSGLFP